MEEEKKDWFDTIFIAVLGVGQILLGVALMAVGTPIMGYLGQVLIAQGIGDIISSAVSFIKDTPLNMDHYLKGKGMSIAITMITVGIVNGLESLELINPGYLGNGLDPTILKNQGFAAAIQSSIASSAMMQIGVQILGTMLVKIGKQAFLDEGEMRERVLGSINELMLSHQSSVQQVFVGDGWEGSHTRVGSHKRVEGLEERAQVIMTNCNERFEDTTTKLATGVASNLAGMAANAYSGGDPLSWSNVLNKLGRGALGGIKSLEALDYFNDKMGVAIDESSAGVPNPRVMYTSRISKTCEGQSIESLVSTLEQSNIMKDQSLDFERCAEIQTLEQLPECKEGMASICKRLNATVNNDYKIGKETFKGNLVSLLTGNMMVMVETQVIEPLAFAAAEVTLDVVKDINKRMEKQEQEEKLRREQEESKVREKLFTYNQDIFKAHENNANQEEATSDSQEQKRGKKGDEKVEVVKVKRGDTVSKLAKDRGQSVEDVVKANPWLEEKGRVERDADGNIKHVLIKPDEKLVMPVTNASPGSSNTNKEDKKDEFNLRGKDAKEFLEFLKSYNKDPKAPNENGQDAPNNQGANCPGDGAAACGHGYGQGKKEEVYGPQRPEDAPLKENLKNLLKNNPELIDEYLGFKPGKADDKILNAITDEVALFWKNIKAAAKVVGKPILEYMYEKYPESKGYVEQFIENARTNPGKKILPDSFIDPAVDFVEVGGAYLGYKLTENQREACEALTVMFAAGKLGKNVGQKAYKPQTSKIPDVKGNPNQHHFKQDNHNHNSKPETNYVKDNNPQNNQANTDHRPIWTEGKIQEPVKNAHEHWKDHKKDFPQYQNAVEYVKGAKEFINNPPNTAKTLTRSNGDKVIYDPISDIFAVSDKNGIPRTMYKPIPGVEHKYNTNLEYFYAQQR